MLTNEPSIHRTFTRKAQSSQQDGWEFECPICGYWVRYTSRTISSASQLEILHLGDTQARHFSNPMQVKLVEAQPVTVMDGDDDDDEVWLTPELRQQMEDLLRDVNLGDWEVY